MHLSIYWLVLTYGFPYVCIKIILWLLYELSFDSNSRSWFEENGRLVNLDFIPGSIQS